MGLKTGQSAGGGNATVPGDAPIQPPQAFVDNIAKFLNSGADLDISNQGITHLDPGIAFSYLKFRATQVTPSLDASGNTIPASEITGLFDLITSDGFNVDVLDFSGVNMGSIVPADTTITAQVPTPIPGGGTVWQWNNGGGAHDVIISFNGAMTLAQSGKGADSTNDSNTTIGVSDSPSASQIAAKIAEIGITFSGAPITCSASGDQFTYTQSDPVRYYLPNVVANTAGLTAILAFTDPLVPKLRGVIEVNCTPKVNASGTLKTYTPPYEPES